MEDIQDWTASEYGLDSKEDMECEADIIENIVLFRILPLILRAMITSYHWKCCHRLRLIVSLIRWILVRISDFD